MLRLEWIPTSVRLERRTTNMVDPHSQLDCAALKSQSQRAHEFTYGTEQVDTGGRANGRRHCAREAAATLHSSAKGRDEHAPWVRLHLAPWSSRRKLAPSVGASSRLRCRPQSVQVLGRGGKHSPTAVPEPETSTHRESLTRPRTVEHPQACSISRSFMAAPLQDTVQVRGRGSKHSHAECKRQRRARTLRPPPPCTVQHPQACSISESVMAAPLQTTISAGAWSRQQAICTRVPKADTSTHLASASTLHRAAAVASLLHQ